MRIALYTTVALLVTSSPVPVSAADVSEAGARAIMDRLTYYLPKAVVDTGFLKLTPGTQRYDLTVDLMPLLRSVPASEFTISGLSPFTQYLTPQDNGFWKIEGSDDLNVSGTVSANDEKTSFNYMIEKYAYDAIFDPELTFTRVANFRFDNIELKSSSGPTTADVSLGSYRSDMRAENVQNGAADVVTNMSGRGFKGVFTEPSSGPVTVTAASMDGRWQAETLGIAAVRDLIVFGLDRSKAGPEPLTSEQSTRLKALIKANVPLVDRLSEEVHLRDIKVTNRGVEVTIADVGYKFEFSGIKSNTRMGFQFSVTDPVIPPSLLPPGTAAALPRSANLGVAITGLNLEGAATYLIENADFTKSNALSLQQSSELGKIVLPDGKMHLEFYNVTARSDVYDLALSGRMMVDPENSERPEVDVTITARDLDKTVKFLQDNAQTVPQFGQAAFMLLAMKGFGKEQTDRSVDWNVKLDASGKVLINGREMPQ